MSNDVETALKDEIGGSSRQRHASSVLTTLGIMAFGAMLGTHAYAVKVQMEVPTYSEGYAALGEFYTTAMLAAGVVATVGLVGGVAITMFGGDE